MTGVYLHLFNGRDHVDQPQDDWGDDGATLGPFDYFDYIHITHLCDLQLGALGNDGWELPIEKDALRWRGKYYGDFSIFAATDAEQQHYQIESLAQTILELERIASERRNPSKGNQ